MTFEIEKKTTHGDLAAGKAGETSNYLWFLAQKLCKSSLVPKQYQAKPEETFAALLMGAELGIRPMAALRNIAVINGLPVLFGDMPLALVRQSGLLEYMDEQITSDGEVNIGGNIVPNWKVTCKLRRIGDIERTQSFSVKDALDAKIYKNVWLQHPQRMAKYRARSFLLRDVFPDVLQGIHSEYESGDFELGTHKRPQNVTPLSESNFSETSPEINDKLEKEMIEIARNIKDKQAFEALNEHYSEDIAELRERKPESEFFTIFDNLKF